MLTYQQALDYLYTFIDHSLAVPAKYAAAFDLARMMRLLELLGNPHQRYPSIHIAGTKGKGSVAALCASVLKAAGYRTGFYTSPHLMDFRERMQVNGEMISEDAVTRIVSRLQALQPQVPEITTFELTTALAFEFFAETKVEVAVLEVGLGGRLDATNVVTPLVSVITSLSYDHMALLGNTLTEIAGEKAGIIKPNVPVVIAPQVEEARAELIRIAAERNAPLIEVGRDWVFAPVEHSLDGQTFSITPAPPSPLTPLPSPTGRGAGSEGEPTTLRIPLLGQHQVENAAVAYAALMRCGLAISPAALADGFRSVQWPGRFEILRTNPYLIVDGAHNHDSAQKLARTITEYFPGKPITLIFGASADKDITGMLSELLPLTTRVIATHAVHPRALDPNALAALITTVPTAIVPTVPQAVQLAIESSAPADVIVVTGSLFVVAETRKVLAGWSATHYAQ